MSKKINLTLIAIMITFSSFAQLGQLKYKLPDTELKAKKICGKKICDPGNVGKLLHYTFSPFSPTVKKATTAEEIALQVLGQTLPADKMLSSKDFSTCSDLSNNPFTVADIEPLKFVDGRSIDYERSEQIELNVTAAVDANIKELMKLTTDAAKIERLKAKIEASYNKVKGKKLTVVGKYSEWGLSKDAREKLKKGDGFQDCRKWIENKENPQRILLAVGIVYFEIKYEENSLDQLAAEIDSELAKEGLTGSLSFTFKREVTKRFKAESEVYQILIVRHAGIKGKEFDETF